jgi:hypothetical protein
VQAGEQSVVVTDPVKRRVGEGRVHRLRKLERDEVLAQDRGAVAERLAGMLDHRRGDVDRVHPAARHPVGELRRHPPGAAAGVEHDLVAGQLEPVELLACPAELNVGDAVIRRGVPVACWARRAAHSAVVTGPGRSRSRS